MEDVVNKVSRLRTAVVGREVIAIIVYVRGGEGFSKLARANGIRVVSHYGEEVSSSK